MADQNITELPIKTNTGVASTDYMLGIDSAEGYQILVRDVAKYIVENYNGSTIAGSAQTIQSALSKLNSKITVGQISASANATLAYGSAALLLVFRQQTGIAVIYALDTWSKAIVISGTAPSTISVSITNKTATVENTGNTAVQYVFINA